MTEPRPHPWRLRIQHEGLQGLRLERPGRALQFDPPAEPLPGAVVLLTWNWPEHLDGTARAVAAGARPTVVARPEVLAWLERRGAVDGHVPPVTLDGVRITAFDYAPIPYATPVEAVRKVRSGLLRPDRAAARLWRRLDLPRVAPWAVALDLPDGTRLVHLNLALHGGTPEPWLAGVPTRDADWVVVGVDYGEDDAVVRLAPRLGARRLLVADLVGEVRGERLGMPTAPVTPVVDRLRRDGVGAYVLARRSALRFE